MQFYNVTLDNSTPALAYGSIQDDGSRRGRIDLSAGPRSSPRGRLDERPGGEGSHHAIDPTDLSVVFSHGFYGNFTRTIVTPPVPATNGGRQGGGRGRGRGAATNIRPQSSDVELRAQWMAPIVASVHTPGVIYAGYQFVYRSPDRGASWSASAPI